MGSPPDFFCECIDDARPACAGQPFFAEHDGKQYCVLHYPARSKWGTFRRALQKKFDDEDFDFKGVWFPDDLDWTWTTFEKKADFRWAVFNGVTVLSRCTFMERADFSYAEFVKDVYFSYAEFNHSALFDTATFRGLAYFRRAVFRSRAKFESATFGGEADFTVTGFHGTANFGYTTCASYVKFSSDKSSVGFDAQSSLDFEYANVEKPERISFNALSLKPRWFINSDPRKFDFANVTWVDPPVGEVLRTLAGEKVSQPHRRLSLAYRQLAVNAEENNRYGEASDFRYRAMDARRRERGRGFAFWTLDWWYWLASGYGERVAQAFVVLLFLWLLFAVSYRHVGFARWEPKLSSEIDATDPKRNARDEVGRPLTPGQSVAYSFGTLALQKPEPRPATTRAHLFVLLETLLGPLQAALLALAIRRKFMR